MNEIFRKLTVIIVITGGLFAQSGMAADPAFGNLDFETMNGGTQIVETIGGGFEVVNKNVDYWLDVNSTHTNIGVTAGGPTGSNIYHYTCPTSYGGGTYQISQNTQLVAGDLLTVTGYSRDANKAEYDISLRYATAKDSAFTDLVVMKTVAPSPTVEWGKFTMTHIVTAAEAGKYPAISIIGYADVGGPSDPWGGIDDITFTVSTPTPTSFSNLGFETMNGGDTINQILNNGYDMNSNDIDGWLDAGTNVDCGVLITPYVRTGSTAGFVNSSDPGAYQIEGITPLVEGEQLTLTWYSNDSYSGIHEVSLMIAPTATSSFVDLVSVDSQVSAIADDWVQYTLTHIVTADQAGRFAAIHFHGISEWSSLDDFSYSVVAPTTSFARNDLYSMDSGTLLTVAPLAGVLANDTVLNGDTVTVVTDGTTSKLGTYSIADDGSFTYTPAAGFTGNDSFTYTLASSTATVFIAVKGMLFHYQLNEAPSVTTVADSSGNGFSSSETLPDSIALRGTDYLYDTDKKDERYSAEITTDAQPIKVLGLSMPPTMPGITYLGWVKPKSGVTIDAFTGVMGTRIGGTSILGISSDNLNFHYKWKITESSTALYATQGEWTFVALTIDHATGTATLFSGHADGTSESEGYTDNNYKVEMPYSDLTIGQDTSSDDRTFIGNLRNMRMYNYALPVSTLQALFQAELNNVLTPAIDLVLTQTGRTLTWTVGEEIGVISYTVINAETGETIATLTAENLGSYTVELPEGVNARLVVNDNYGSQTYVPTNGNKITTPYDLVKGWNLIAITGKNAELAALNAVTTGVIWAWNGSTYEKATTTTATQAVWVDASKSQQVDIVSDKSDAEINLNTGWNLVGPVENCHLPEGALSVFSYDQRYKAIAAKDDVLIRGVGYWVFSL